MARKIRILSSNVGYDLAAADYDKKEKYLNSFEKGQLMPLICGSSANCHPEPHIAVRGKLREGAPGIKGMFRSAQHDSKSGNPQCLRGQKVLDAGAGTGRLSIELARRGADVTALDVSEEMLNVLKKKNSDIKIVVGDIENLQFENNYFDWVVSAFVIVHLKNPKRFFDEVYRVLKDGGKFLVTNINQKEAPEVETKTGKIKIESFYHRPEEVREILESLAFNIEKEVFVKEGENWVNQILVAKK